MKPKILPIITTIIVALVSMTPKTHAATIIVNSTADSGSGSLRDSLATTMDGDTIDASSITGTITLTGGELLVSNSVSIIGPGPDQLAINGNHASRVLSIGSGVTVTISSLTITNGNVASGGGGIHNDSATLTVSNCIFSGNASTDWGGGGIYNDGFGFNNRSARLTVVNSIFSSNVANSVGGGIFNDGRNGGSATLEIVGSTFSGNSATLHGGGIYSAGSTILTISNCTLNGNVASSAGAGIYNDHAALEIIDSTIRSNTTLLNGSGGGGIYSAHGTLIVNRCTVIGNSAASGGGIYNNGQFGGSATANVINTTLSHNTANIGGGIVNWGSAGNAMMVIVNCTLSGNSARGPFSAGGGIWNATSGAGIATLNMVSTILEAGSSGANIAIQRATVTSLGYNLSSDGGGGFLTATGDQINTDPKLGPLQDNGGPTFTHALLSGSTAINAGDPNFTPPPDFDQRGPGHPRVVCDHIDIGAFEMPDTTPPVVTCPANIMIDATSPTGAVVSFPTASASDNCSVASAGCSPASGSTFAIGTTTVTCKAIDDSANTNACTFTVYVKGAYGQIGDLIALVQNMTIDKATKNSLLVKLQAALTALGNDDKTAACAKLQDFINLCNAQKGKKITAAQATLLTNEALRIRAVLGC